MKRAIVLKVNGEHHDVLARPTDTLALVLRERLLLTGTKEACGIGECGACSVLLDGRAVNSCLVLAVDVEGQEIVTVEGLAERHVAAGAGAVRQAVSRADAAAVVEPAAADGVGGAAAHASGVAPVRVSAGSGDAGPALTPVQEAFVEHGAIHCGFCTPGMVVTATDYLENSPRRDREALKRAIEGNVCRCTGYVKIVAAIEAAQERMYGASTTGTGGD